MSTPVETSPPTSVPISFEVIWFDAIKSARVPPFTNVVPRILLVDDDPLVTRATRRLLRRAGFDVEATNRSYGVLNLVAESRPDVVVMDINMPGLKGGELLELLRRDPELADTRVLFFSGLSECELETRAEEAGADGFVQKNADPEQLVRLLRVA